MQASNYIKTDNNDNLVEIKLSILVFEEGDFYIAYCPSLELSSYGDSIDDAKVGFDEVLEGYIETCNENGSLGDDLTKHGWTVLESENEAEPPAFINLNIPGGVLRQQFNEKRMVAVC